MTAEDAVSLGTVLEENHDTYKEYIRDYIRQLSTQVRSDSFHLLLPSSSSGLLLPPRRPSLGLSANTRIFFGIFKTVRDI